MPNRFQTCLRFALIVVTACVTALPLSALDKPKVVHLPTAHEIERKRMNLASHQRMLTQRIVTSGCMIAADVDVARQEKILHETIETYRISLQTLRLGNVPAQIPPETDPAVLASLDAAEKSYRGARRELESWLETPPSAERIRDFLPVSAEMLGTAKATVKVLQGRADLTPMQAKLSRAVDIAGRQRMFAQRAVKDVCLASLAGERPFDRLKRNQSVATLLAAFEVNARSLHDGNAMMRLVSAPTQETLWGVEASKKAWDGLRLPLRAAISGPQLAPDALALIADRFEVLLPILDDTVWYYTNF